jgi:hypothetical protein
VSNVRVIIKFICGKGQRLQGSVEIGYAILGEQADEIQPSDREFAFGRREDGAVNMNQLTRKEKVGVLKTNL